MQNGKGSKISACLTIAFVVVASASTVRASSSIPPNIASDYPELKEADQIEARTRDRFPEVSDAQWEEEFRRLAPGSWKQVRDLRAEAKRRFAYDRKMAFVGIGFIAIIVAFFVCGYLGRNSPGDLQG